MFVWKLGRIELASSKWHVEVDVARVAVDAEELKPITSLLAFV